MSTLMLPRLPRLNDAQKSRIHSVEFNKYGLARYIIAGEGGDWAVECLGVRDDGRGIWQTTDAQGVIVGEGGTFEDNLVLALT
jgi:hypothetical protein